MPLSRIELRCVIIELMRYARARQLAREAIRELCSSGSLTTRLSRIDLEFFLLNPNDVPVMPEVRKALKNLRATWHRNDAEGDEPRFRNRIDGTNEVGRRNIARAALELYEALLLSNSGDTG
jgi:hypothetical protein